MEIRSSTSLRNEYNKVSDYCKATGEPVFLTKNGDGDLVVMSIESYEDREETLRIREKLLEVEYARLKGAKPYTVDDLAKALSDIVD